MKIYLTLDYELFLGSIMGSVESCLVRPMEYLCGMADKYNIKFTIFVDACYLLALKKFMKYEEIDRDYKTVIDHLLFLKQNGHHMGLHLHPHWLYADYNGNDWTIAPNHYKLSDIPLEEAKNIVIESKLFLEEIVNEKIKVFRAGGFSIQPFEPYSELFKEIGLDTDSSVLSGMNYDSDNQQYDYRDAPYKDFYCFNSDICKENSNGLFNEYPIATHIISPVFWWKLSVLKILSKITGEGEHKIFGDGRSVETTSESIISRLTKPQMAFACMDGYKSSLLFKMQEKHLRQFGKNSHFVIIGHPKLASSYSVGMLDKFILESIIDNSFEIL
jgi:hypothetical protein